MGRILFEGQDVFRPNWVGKRFQELTKELGLLFEEYICIDRQTCRLLVNPKIRDDVDWEIKRVLSKG